MAVLYGSRLTQSHWRDVSVIPWLCYLNNTVMNTPRSNLHMSRAVGESWAMGSSRKKVKTLAGTVKPVPSSNPSHLPSLWGSLTIDW